MGLRKGDLANLIDNTFEIDSFKSKMGADKNIVTLSFSVSHKDPADDLVKFLEGGYTFILDANFNLNQVQHFQKKKDKLQELKNLNYCKQD